jgi:protein ImuB
VVASLAVLDVPAARVGDALAAVAEVALGFGITAAVTAPCALEDGQGAGDEGGAFDTVWIDVTGTERLFGSERQLLVELADAVGELGHEVRLGVAEGPILARALACWGVTPPGEVGVVATPERIAALPVVALPIAVERATWLLQLGVSTLGELAALPRGAVASRLAGEPRGGRHRSEAPGSRRLERDARILLELCRGRDPTLLVPYHPPRVLVEETSFEEGISGVEPLRFALRGLAARLAARLGGRGEAAASLTVTLALDASAARLAGHAPEVTLDFAFAAPIWREPELRRVIAARLERLTLPAPTLALRLTVSSVTERATRQLDLARVSDGSFVGAREEDALPVLLAELVGDIGPERVGVLRVADSYRPEAQTLLVSAVSTGGRSERLSRIGGARERRPPVRIFAHPVPLTAALRPESVIVLGGHALTIARVDFERRLEAVEWWSRRPTSRDYYRLLLRSEPRRGGEERAWGRATSDGGDAGGWLEALVYVDRGTGERFLQGIYD